MNSRERFEAWFAKYSPGCASHSHDLLDAWQEAERQALERAAQMLEKLADDFAGEYGHDDMGALSFGQGAHAHEKMDKYTDMKDYAEAIRALIDAQSGEEKAP